MINLFYLIIAEIRSWDSSFKNLINKTKSGAKLKSGTKR